MLGAVAWPMMRRAGYPPDTGGAILAAAGIGAILAPPAMGAAAFLIAEFLNISYCRSSRMASIPAALYYLSIFLMVEADSPARSRLRRRRADCSAGAGDPRRAGTTSRRSSAIAVLHGARRDARSARCSGRRSWPWRSASCGASRRSGRAGSRPRSPPAARRAPGGGDHRHRRHHRRRRHADRAWAEGRRR